MDYEKLLPLAIVGGIAYYLVSSMKETKVAAPTPAISTLIAQPTTGAAGTGAGSLTATQPGSSSQSNTSDILRLGLTAAALGVFGGRAQGTASEILGL
jgi:hypothetical protein